MEPAMRRPSVLLAALLAFLSLASAARAQDPAEMLLRLDRLEQLVRQLNGQIEQLANQNRRLEEQNRRFQNDTDFRFKELEAGRSGAARPVAPAAPQAPAAPGRTGRNDAFDPSANPAAPGAPQSLGSPGSASAPPRQLRDVSQGVVATPGQIIAGQQNTLGRDPRGPVDIATPPADAAPATPQGQIELGRQQLTAGQYDAAEATFREFIRARPRDRLLPDAMMGLADSFYQRQRWREAAEFYVDLTTRFPKSRRAPEAELKLGISLRGLGATKEACDVLANHPRKYPAASNAVKQGVTREQQRARCPAA
jgi:tol-pal system protein YbgF